MSHPRRTPARALAAIAAIAAALLLAGCVNTAREAAQREAAAVTEDPLTTMIEAVQTMFTWHPGRDASSADAYARAAPFLTTRLVEENGAGSERGPGVQWEEWARDGATVVATAVPVAAEAAQDDGDSATRLVTLTQRATYPDGRAVEVLNLTATVTAVATAEGWRVDSVEF